MFEEGQVGGALQIYPKGNMCRECAGRERLKSGNRSTEPAAHPELSGKTEHQWGPTVADSALAARLRSPQGSTGHSIPSGTLLEAIWDLGSLPGTNQSPSKCLLATLFTHALCLHSSCFPASPLLLGRSANVQSPAWPCQVPRLSVPRQGPGLTLSPLPSHSWSPSGVSEISVPLPYLPPAAESGLSSPPIWILPQLWATRETLHQHLLWTRAMPADHSLL